MLKRKAYDRLVEWKRSSDGKTALLVEGARRVGKSTLVDEFGRNEYRSHLVMDFFRAPSEIKRTIAPISTPCSSTCRRTTTSICTNANR